MLKGPQRIVCLTEETTEWLYLLGQEHRIVGISAYTVRPERAKNEKPVVSAFISGSLPKILAPKPDWVVGFSDIQGNLAKQLIEAGLHVMVFNQRSIEEIFSVMETVAAIVGQTSRAETWVSEAIEIDSAVILQPGPALFLEGIDRLSEAITSF